VSKNQEIQVGMFILNNNDVAKGPQMDDEKNDTEVAALEQENLSVPVLSPS
jgi:hypothetical protein